jgi:hypothetical protein
MRAHTRSPNASAVGAAGGHAEPFQIPPDIGRSEARGGRFDRSIEPHRPSLAYARIYNLAYAAHRLLEELGGGGAPYLFRQKWRAARYSGELSMAWGIAIAPLLPGSGKLVLPWVRMQFENVSACARTCCEGWVTEDVGNCDLQAFSADETCERLTPSSWSVSGDRVGDPLLPGSGQSGTPWVRMHAANATPEPPLEGMRCVVLVVSCAT